MELLYKLSIRFDQILIKSLAGTQRLIAEGKASGFDEKFVMFSQKIVLKGWYFILWKLAKGPLRGPA